MMILKKVKNCWHCRKFLFEFKFFSFCSFLVLYELPPPPSCGFSLQKPFIFLQFIHLFFFYASHRWTTVPLWDSTDLRIEKCESPAYCWMSPFYTFAYRKCSTYWRCFFLHFDHRVALSRGDIRVKYTHDGYDCHFTRALRYRENQENPCRNPASPCTPEAFLKGQHAFSRMM